MRVSLYLQHHHADLFDTLDDGLRGPGDGHSSLRGVWQHVSCNLDLSPCGLKAGDTAGHQLLHWSRTRLWLGCGGSQLGSATSLISLILEPPFPMRDPHWLAGTTNLRVTGGLLVAGLLLMELMMS